MRTVREVVHDVPRSLPGLDAVLDTQAPEPAAVVLEGARAARVLWLIGEDSGLYLRDLLLQLSSYLSAYFPTGEL